MQVEDILPKEYLKVTFKIDEENKRTISIEGIGRYKKIEEAL